MLALAGTLVRRYWPWLAGAAVVIAVLYVGGGAVADRVRSWRIHAVLGQNAEAEKELVAARAELEAAQLNHRQVLKAVEVMGLRMEALQKSADEAKALSARREARAVQLELGVKARDAMIVRLEAERAAQKPVGSVKEAADALRTRGY